MTAVERLPGLPVTVERDVECSMRDGIVLRADVYRPEATGPHPVVLLRTPYNKTVAQSDSGYAHPSWYARHGYVVVVQDTRGRWASEGTFWPFRSEGDDGFDSVEWAARLPGGDGRVSMIGYSYAGAAQLLAAMEQPPSLASICPAFTASPGDGWFRRGGAFSLAFARSWALSLARDDRNIARDEMPPYYREWLDGPAGLDWPFEKIAVPCLHIGGWWDVFIAQTVETFRRVSAVASAPQKLLVGPWLHEPWHSVGTNDPSAGATAIDDWQLRWLEHVLERDRSDAFAEPVTAYVVGDGWRDFDAWPPTAGRATELFLHSDGRANSAGGDGVLSANPPGDELPDVFVHDPEYPPPSAGGHSCCDPAIAPVGPASQMERESSKAVLVYTSAELEEDLELVGDPALTLFAASSADDTDFAARLCVVDEAGGSTNVQEGIVRARFRDSLVDPAPIEPSRVYEYRIALGPVALRVPAGHRLRLSLSSSDHPMWDLNGTTVVTQVVLHDRDHPSRLSLPVSS